jgi:ligand-binding SRPBCC domain-containing protein
MPHYLTTIELPFPVPHVFAFFLRPANVAALSPPEPRLELVEGPELLTLGARVTWKGRRWGVAYRIVTEVTALETDARLVEEQRQGPLRKWQLTRRFEATPQGTRLTEEIEFEPPGGLLGFAVTAGTIEQDLDAAYAHRDRRLPELLAVSRSPDR